VNWLLLLLAISIPNCSVRAEYQDSVAKLQLVIEAEPCDYAGWTGPDKRIHICATPGLNPAWVASHEMTHILAGHNLPGNTDWDAFSRKAIEALRREPYTMAELSQAKYMATYGGQELHAELPWIVGGEIPGSLERYYPWLEPSVELKSK
jgi:hypothetical protein